MRQQPVAVSLEKWLQLVQVHLGSRAVPRLNPSRGQFQAAEALREQHQGSGTGSHCGSGDGSGSISRTAITLSRVTYCRLSVSFRMRMRYCVILVNRCLHLCRMKRGQ